MKHKLPAEQAHAMAYECGKRRDSQGFAKLYMQTSVRFADLKASYDAGLWSTVSFKRQA